MLMPSVYHRSSHACSLISSCHSLELSADISCSHQPVTCTQFHSHTPRLLFACRLAAVYSKFDSLSAFSSFTLLFAPSPHRLTSFIISSAYLRRVISHLNHKNLSVESKRQRLLTKLNHHISAVVINIIFTSLTRFT